MITLKSSLHLIALLTSFLAYVIIVTTKGFFSAWVTKQMGDPTAQQEGYLSWNPLVHVDIIGAFCLLFLGLGWGKTIPIDHRNIPNRAKLTIAYLAGSIAYMLIAIVALTFLLKVFGFKILYVAKQASSVRFLGLSQLSAVYPGYSSFILSLALIVVDMMYFGILLTGIHGILQGFRLVLILFFPDIIYRRETELIILFMPLLLLLLFIEPLITFIWSVVFFFGTLLGYVFGAS